jgi:hypothetical protein
MTTFSLQYSLASGILEKFRRNLPGTAKPLNRATNDPIVVSSQIELFDLSRTVKHWATREIKRIKQWFKRISELRFEVALRQYFKTEKIDAASFWYFLVLVRNVRELNSFSELDFVHYY